MVTDIPFLRYIVAKRKRMTSMNSTLTLEDFYPSYHFVKHPHTFKILEYAIQTIESQAEVSSVLNVSQKTVNKWFTKKVEIDMQKLRPLIELVYPLEDLDPISVKVVTGVDFSKETLQKSFEEKLNTIPFEEMWQFSFPELYQKHLELDAEFKVSPLEKLENIKKKIIEIDEQNYQQEDEYLKNRKRALLAQDALQDNKELWDNLDVDQKNNLLQLNPLPEEPVDIDDSYLLEQLDDLFDLPIERMHSFKAIMTQINQKLELLQKDHNQEKYEYKTAKRDLNKIVRKFNENLPILSDLTFPDINSRKELKDFIFENTDVSTQIYNDGGELVCCNTHEVLAELIDQLPYKKEYIEVKAEELFSVYFVTQSEGNTQSINSYTEKEFQDFVDNFNSNSSDSALTISHAKIFDLKTNRFMRCESQPFSTLNPKEFDLSRQRLTLTEELTLDELLSSAQDELIMDGVVLRASLSLESDNVRECLFNAGYIVPENK
jgi:hypothetical protein